MTPPSVLVLSYSNLRSDPRVRRQIRALATRHRVTSCGYGDTPPGAERHIAIPYRRSRWLAKAVDAAKLKLGLYESYYWRQPRVRTVLSALSASKFRLIVANDLSALPVALEIAGNATVIYDAHEYSPLEFEDRWLWRFLFHRYAQAQCRRYVPRAALMLTVCQGIAERYAAELGVRCEVITNAAPYVAAPVRITRPDRIRMVHHGAAMRSRRIEAMIDLLQCTDSRFSLDLLLVPQDAGYLAELRRRAEGNSRIRFRAPVELDQLPTVLSEYDIGLYLLAPTNVNNRLALPNKFFEFIQARLAVAIGPSPEMARLVRQFDCGVVGDSFDPRALASLLNECSTEDFDRMKNGAAHASEVLNAEANERHFLSMIDELLGGDQEVGRASQLVNG